MKVIPFTAWALTGRELHHVELRVGEDGHGGRGGGGPHGGDVGEAGGELAGAGGGAGGGGGDDHVVAVQRDQADAGTGLSTRFTLLCQEGQPTLPACFLVTEHKAMVCKTLLPPGI